MLTKKNNFPSIPNKVALKFKFSDPDTLIFYTFLSSSTTYKVKLRATLLANIDIKS